MTEGMTSNVCNLVSCLANISTSTKMCQKDPGLTDLNFIVNVVFVYIYT